MAKHRVVCVLLIVLAIVGSGFFTSMANAAEAGSDDLAFVGVAETVDAPDTGTITMAGASAKAASIMAAVAVGVMTSIVSFAYLNRRR